MRTRGQHDLLNPPATSFTSPPRRAGSNSGLGGSGLSGSSSSSNAPLLPPQLSLSPLMNPSAAAAEHQHQQQPQPPPNGIDIARTQLGLLAGATGRHTICAAANGQLLHATLRGPAFHQILSQQQPSESSKGDTQKQAGTQDRNPNNRMLPVSAQPEQRNTAGRDSTGLFLLGASSGGIASRNSLGLGGGMIGGQMEGGVMMGFGDTGTKIPERPKQALEAFGKWRKLKDIARDMTGEEPIPKWPLRPEAGPPQPPPFALQGREQGDEEGRKAGGQDRQVRGLLLFPQEGVCPEWPPLASSRNIMEEEEDDDGDSEGWDLDDPIPVPAASAPPCVAAGRSPCGPKGRPNDWHHNVPKCIGKALGGVGVGREHLARFTPLCGHHHDDIHAIGRAMALEEEWITARNLIELEHHGNLWLAANAREESKILKLIQKGGRPPPPRDLPR
uniref:Uncharacterized protein n=1 Tax=Chromera velia CCMP2878 TaxID=1169474 RepID=A0A0G4HXM1_9ALVE|eukprot:Cvel_9291.t1-p1 / transcript=Cvel_9291.t1 / gene=Cvel_9291 / organism=Chromera_velia_CCMP2878 / gene_product=hypothetical protein / transcript_product=hypothetical protein / location=Cvel_scaffold531:74849-78672(+) / protein_length=444 / sequence_SO=supercontig / SO=protein_coding / is_pseudo=false